MFKEKIYCGVDIGAQSLKAGILKVKDSHEADLVGVYQNETHGFNKTGVSNLNEFSECIHATIHSLAKKTGLKLKEVHLGVGAEFFEVRPTSTVIPLSDRGSKTIVTRDMKKVNHQARLLSVQIDEEIIHDVPQYYRVDDAHPAINPLGLYGRKLGVHSLMIVARVNALRNITKAVQQAGLDVGSFSLNSYASSDIVFKDQEQKKGCILIDIGSTATSILVFKEGGLHSLEKLGFGGNHLTQALATDLNLPFELAEEIKKSYANIASSDQHQEEEILVKKEETYVPVKRAIISLAIEPKVEHFIKRINAILKQMKESNSMSGGITLIGGGSLLPGLLERIERESGLPTRLGQIHLKVHKDFSNAAIFAPTIGLAYNSMHRGMTARRIFANGHQGWSKQVVSTFRELYQEYF